MQSIEPLLLMENVCHEFRSNHGWLGITVICADASPRTLHVGIAMRTLHAANHLTDDVIDDLVSRCSQVALHVLGLEMESVVYVPRDWKPIDRAGQPGQADEATPEGVLQPEQNCQPVRESEPGSPSQEAGKRSGRGSRKRTPSKA